MCDDGASSHRADGVGERLLDAGCSLWCQRLYVLPSLSGASPLACLALWLWYVCMMWCSAVVCVTARMGK